MKKFYVKDFAENNLFELSEIKKMEEKFAHFTFKNNKAILHHKGHKFEYDMGELKDWQIRCRLENIGTCPICNENIVPAYKMRRHILDFEEVADSEQMSICEKNNSITAYDKNTIIFKIYFVTLWKEVDDPTWSCNHKELQEIIVVNPFTKKAYKHYFQNSKIQKNLLLGQKISDLTLFPSIIQKLNESKLVNRLGINHLIMENNKKLDMNILYSYIHYYCNGYEHIEQLAKSEYTKKLILNDIHYIKNLNKKSNIIDILGISKNVIKKIYEEDIWEQNYCKIFEIFNIFKNGKLKIETNMDYIYLLDIMKQVYDIYYFEKKLRKLKEVIEKFDYNIKIKNIKEYIDKANLYQAIENPSIVLEIWGDYLNMVGQMELKSYELYPKSLKLSHDIMTRNYKYQKNAIKEKRFLERLEEMKKYEIENDNYKVIAPSQIQEIIDEGNALKHCVASYIDDVIEAKTTIMFVRKKDNIQKPLYTIEIKDGAIVQAKGFANSAIIDPEVLDLLSKLERKLNTMKAEKKIS